MARPLRTAASGFALAAILASACAPETRAQAAGGIRGSIYDADFDVPLDGVRVTVIEAQATALTAEDGTFLFDRLEPGSYTLTYAKSGFERQVRSGVVVTPGRLTDASLDLASEVIEMEELIVTGTDFLASSEIGALEIRAASVTLQDSISSELISRAGASDVAGALKLVVGASIVEGKYATVRGLSDRYTGTTLNGIRIPSADPRRRAVQVDLFPTGTVENVTVTKTFTPDLQGDFTGGGVDIQTKSVPENLVLNVSASVGWNSLATGEEEFLTYRGAGVGTFAQDGGGRDLPTEALQLPGLPRYSANPSQEDRDAAEAYHRAVTAFAPTMGVSRRRPGSDRSLKLVAGNRFELGDGLVLGLLGGLSWSHSYSFYEDAVNDNAIVSGPAAPLTSDKPRRDSRGKEEVIVGALANVVLQHGVDHELSLRFLRNQSAEDEARFQVQNPDEQTVEQNQALHYTERSVQSLQLGGRHGLLREALRLGGGEPKGLDLRWVLASNSTRQYEPDLRFFRNIFDTENLGAQVPSNSTDAQNTRRIWRDIDESNTQLKLDFDLPFTAWNGRDGRIRWGAFVDDTEREYEQSSFTYQFQRQFGSLFDPVVAENLGCSRFAGEEPDELWTDHFSDCVGYATNDPPAPNQLLWVLVPLGNDVDYAGAQRIEAAYAMGEIPLHPRVTLTAGARIESTKLAIDPSNDEFGTVEVIRQESGGARVINRVAQEEAAARIEDERWLPAVNATWEILPNMKLRASWSRTLARPTFRELAPVATEEFLFGDEFLGSPDLRLSSIENQDLRWEWFRRPGEVLAVSVFRKKLRDPIELLSFSASNRSFIQPVNFERGEVFGFELEARTGLDLFWKKLAGLSLGVNYTFLETEVEVPQVEQDSLASFGLEEPTRRLQGQPEYIFNFSLTYDNEPLKLSAGLFYNLVGETLLTGAARGVEDGSPNVFEKSHGTLDLKVSRRFNHRFSLALRAQNLLTPNRRTVYRKPDGDESPKTDRETALEVSISVSWKF